MQICIFLDLEYNIKKCITYKDENLIHAPNTSKGPYNLGISNK